VACEKVKPSYIVSNFAINSLSKASQSLFAVTLRYMIHLSNNTRKITSRILLTKYERNYFIYVARIIRHALLKHTQMHKPV